VFVFVHVGLFFILSRTTTRSTLVWLKLKRLSYVLVKSVRENEVHEGNKPFFLSLLKPLKLFRRRVVARGFLMPSYMAVNRIVQQERQCIGYVAVFLSNRITVQQ